MTGDPEMKLRAARRRATYSGRIVQLGEEKPAPYAGKSPLERLALQASLVRRLSSLNSDLPAPVPRSDWPGEIFDIDERNSRIRRRLS